MTKLGIDAARAASLTLLLAALSSACTEETCPDGTAPRESSRLVCDDETRQCVTETTRSCPCVPGLATDCQADDSGRCDPTRGAGLWEAQPRSDAPVTVDGRFTGDEWAGAVRLEGLFTDVYVDYRDGRLYFLNDWRANSEGIRRDCFNYFQVRIGEEWIDLRVYGDGRVEATRDGAPAPLSASGAYGFGRSPGNPEPHTIYEFSLAVRGGQFDVCCFDPLTRASCDELAHEPAVISLSRYGSELRVRRSIVPGTVQRLAEGEACGAGEGICEDGLTCEARVCARRPAPRPDAGWPDAGVGDAGPPDPPM